MKNWCFIGRFLYCKHFDTLIILNTQFQDPLCRFQKSIIYRAAPGSLYFDTSWQKKSLNGQHLLSAANVYHLLFIPFTAFESLIKVFSLYFHGSSSSSWTELQAQLRNWKLGFNPYSRHCSNLTWFIFYLVYHGTNWQYSRWWPEVEPETACVECGVYYGGPCAENHFRKHLADKH